jgi:heme oxygenase
MKSVAPEKLASRERGFASEMLKRETHDVHRVVESMGFMKDLLSPSLILESYAKLLRRLLAVVAPIEESLVQSPFLHHFPSVVDRYAVRTLQKDLQFLCHSGDAVSWRGEPFPPCISSGSTAGVLYVMEGSANGGRIFYKFLESRLGLSESSGLSYFGMQAADGGLRFMAFKEELNKNLTHHEVEEAVDSAKLTFRRFA